MHAKCYTSQGTLKNCSYSHHSITFHAVQDLAQSAFSMHQETQKHNKTNLEEEYTDSFIIYCAGQERENNRW